jgi:hypothetical protein
VRASRRALNLGCRPKLTLDPLVIPVSGQVLPRRGEKARSTVRELQGPDNGGGDGNEKK